MSNQGAGYGGGYSPMQQRGGNMGMNQQPGSPYSMGQGMGISQPPFGGKPGGFMPTPPPIQADQPGMRPFQPTPPPIQPEQPGAQRPFMPGADNYSQLPYEGQRPQPGPYQPPIWPGDQPGMRPFKPTPPPIVPVDNSGAPRGGFQPPMPGQGSDQPMGGGLLNRPQNPWDQVQGSQYYNRGGGYGDTFNGR